MSKKVMMKEEDEEKDEGLSTSKKILGVFFGLIIGVLIGSTSVGGGVMVIPMLVIFFGLTTAQTVGSSIIIAVVLTLVTSIIFAKGGSLDVPTALIMWVGSFPGVFFGSKLTIITRCSSNEPYLVVKIDWDDYSAKKSLSSISNNLH